MSIIRICKSEDPYARVNKKLLEDERLHWKSKGIMAYLLGHKDNWEVRASDLVKRSMDGRDAVYSALSELRQLGYARLETTRKAGKIVGKRWIIQDSPSPIPGF